MKNRYALIFLLSAGICHGQNLVPNPSFEDTLSCPFGLGDLTPIVAWNSFGNTPDCFHTCSSMTINIPNSDFGFQYAHSGNAMLGVITYVWDLDPGWPNYREYIGAQLLAPLVIGQKYFVSFFINCAGYIPGWQHIGANKIGARFSTFPYDNSLPTEPDNFSHIHTDSIVTDTLQWFKVAGSFIADSAYQYIVIGNFYDHIQTDTIIFGGEPFGGSAAYYYIDDVCVSTDSLLCTMTTSITNSMDKQELLSAYPNPSHDLITLSSHNELERIIIYNSSGQLIYTVQDTQDKKKTIDTSSFPNGLYIVHIGTGKNKQTLKFAIN